MPHSVKKNTRRTLLHKLRSFNRDHRHRAPKWLAATVRRNAAAQASANAVLAAREQRMSAT